MPYAANVYTVPPGTDATTLTPVDSSDYNAFVADIEAAQNAARPIVAGGTGATSVITAWDGLAKKGTDIATASSINLTTATGPSLSLTGTTTITGVTLAEGSIRIVRAAAVFQITASASLLCNGSASTNLSVSAEDLLLFRGGASSVVSVAKIGSLITKSDIGLGNVDNTSDATKNSATATLTNKRVTPRVTSISSSATPTINTDTCDFVDITALALAVTSMTTNLSGTPTNGQKLIIRFKDNGTARAISWGTGFEAAGVALPTTTVLSKRLTVGFIYDTTTSRWGCVASAQEA